MYNAFNQWEGTNQNNWKWASSHTLLTGTVKVHNTWVTASLSAVANWDLQLDLFAFWVELFTHFVCIIWNNGQLSKHLKLLIVSSIQIWVMQQRLYPPISLMHYLHIQMKDPLMLKGDGCDVEQRVWIWYLLLEWVPMCSSTHSTPPTSPLRDSSTRGRREGTLRGLIGGTFWVHMAKAIS